MTAFWLNVIWMMAEQLCWEKSQGNLELYFAAPMNIMSILLGMAVGGFVMSSTRAVAVLVIATLVFGVTFNVDQWGLLIAVFFLTLAALYGLGMMLASLFLLWGREAFHLTHLLIEPVYFVSGLNFPVGRLGAIGVARDRDDPARRRASTRCASSCSPAQPYITGTPSPEVEALILVAMTVVFCRARALDAPPHRADGPQPRQPVGPLAMSAITPDRATLDPTGPGPLFEPGRFDPARTEGAGVADTVRNLRTAAFLGWHMEANWTDPMLFFIYTVAKPIASLLLLVLMLTIIGRRHRGQRRDRPDVRRPRPRAVGDARRRGSRASPGPSSRTASATGCSSTCT